MNRHNFTSLLLFALALAAGCKVATPVPRTATFVPGSPFPYARPQDVGLSPSRIQSLADRVYDWVKQGRIVGAEVLVVKNHKIVLHEVCGWSDRERGIPLQRNSIYRIRSMTKPFVGTAVLMLAEQNRLSLDNAVAAYIPAFASSSHTRQATSRAASHRTTGAARRSVTPWTR
jgi:CubicO group peptidase (beta-lactamase class C family)